MDTQKSNCFQNIHNPSQKIAKQKSRYILWATETSVEENFFPRSYSVFKPKICNGFELKPLLFLFLSVRTETYFTGELCKIVVF